MRLNFHRQRALRRSVLAAATSLALALLPGLAAAQSLQELYDAARVFDATYLAAKANAVATSPGWCPRLSSPA